MKWPGMCGIAGLVSLDEKACRLDGILEMTRTQRHRGPDDEGVCYFQMGGGRFWAYGGADTPQGAYGDPMPYAPQKPHSTCNHEKATVALGHRRLSILDLSPKGHQPMCTSDRRYWIVYNGEIYNYLELRSELAKSGFSFHSQSDTEVILYGYANWGLEIFNRLVGMFAFAIYDRFTEQILLARDFFGIKPLYYSTWDNGFAFASEIKALLLLPVLSRRMNVDRVHEYLYSGLSDYGPETMFADIRQVPAAHYLLLPLNPMSKAHPVRYWDLHPDQASRLSFQEATSRLRELFLENVNLHLRSDVHVGAALSGGIDSSAIVMCMRHLQGGDLDLHTFSYIAEDPELCEEKWVDLIGAASSSVPYKVTPKAEDLVNDLDDLISIQDEPFGSTSIYAQYCVMRLAREHEIKVMLDGQGADELLAGYRAYWGARLGSLLRELQWVKAYRFFVQTVSHGHSPWPVLLMQAGRCFLPQGIQFRLKEVLDIDLVSRWLNKEWFRERGVRRGDGENGRGQGFMKQALYHSLTRGGLNSLLRYEDRNSMAFSIESRVPFLTPAFASFVWSLPEEYMIDQNGRSKSVFRSAMEGIVPERVLSRKDKVGFATPERRWLSALKTWVQDTLESDVAKSLPMIQREKVVADWREILSNKNSFDWRFWRVINLVKWVEMKNVEIDPSRAS